MKPAIRVENLSKRYQIGPARDDAYQTLRETITETATAAWRRVCRSGPGSDEDTGDFWALKDVSFEIQAGEVVGIIGRNGAGKSTLLKIVSQITEPSSGRVTIRGRVGSLLEVGTGFHPELTGRENIYLNGAILGMSRREIDRKFDEIVAFAEVDRFLDTPVKRYSSGMHVRLAFAIAAHLDPEILVIDEVLAVGDQTFQKKCMGQMGEASRSGRTILFVSHNTAAVEALCHRCLLLQQGQLVAVGSTQDVLGLYQSKLQAAESGTCDLALHANRTSNSTTIMQQVTLRDWSGVATGQFSMGEGLSAQVRFDPRGQRICPVLGVVIKTHLGAAVFGVNNRFIPNFAFDRTDRPGVITCSIDRVPLMPGLYSIDLFFGDDYRDVDVVLDAIGFEVTPADVFGSGKLPPHRAGPVYWPASWILDLNGADDAMLTDAFVRGQGDSR